MNAHPLAELTRRRFLATMVAGMGAARAVSAATSTQPATDRVDGGPDEPFFRTRGVVITPEDLTLSDWPERAAAAGLTTIALHAPVSPRLLAKYVQSPAGQKFLDTCRRLGLAVEYELHAMQDLLSRELFDKAPELFRMDDKGQRIREHNLCVHAEPAMQMVADNAVDLARVLHPTTGRYFYWGDDGRPWCRCPRCVGLSDSDQALLVANRIAAALRKSDPKAQVAYLAYDNTLPPPGQIKPQPGVFLEYAPIHRSYDASFEQAGDDASRKQFEMLDANLQVFGRSNAQVLEYWLDASLFSKWKKPAVKLPFKAEILAADLDTYGRRGIRHVTSFAVYLDAAYMSRYGEPPIRTYGDRLRRWRASDSAPRRARVDAT